MTLEKNRDFVKIQPGEFLFGKIDGKKNYPSQMRAKISRGFYISKHLVTQKLWFSVMDEAQWKENIHAEHEAVKTPLRENIPINYVSYFDVEEFLVKFKEKFGYFVRLPTEVEWEWACRAGTSGDYFWEVHDREEAKKYAHFDFDLPFTLPEVGLLRPNPSGLFDMSGLVDEWVGGIYQISERNPYVRSGTYPEVSEDFIASAPLIGGCGVVRGGNIMLGIFSMASHSKATRSLDLRQFQHGFRLVIEDSK